MPHDHRPADPCETLSGSVHGVHVRGRLPAAFRPYLLPGVPASGEPGRRLDVSYRSAGEVTGGEEVWVSEAEGPEGPLRLVLSRLPNGFGLAVSGLGRGLFRCAPRAMGIEWAASGGEAAHAFACYALPLWLESRGVPVLHGSAVALDGRVIGFVGPTGSGKSTLCAELLRLGWGFVSDDGLALRGSGEGGWRCSHGPPMLRLWPSGLEGRLGIDPRPLPKVHQPLEKRRLPVEPDALAPDRDPLLAALYLLERRPEPRGAVEISPCPPADALARLVEHGVAVGPAAALGFSGHRLRLLADVVERVPVRLLRFPSGVDSTERIREAIVRDR